MEMTLMMRGQPSGGGDDDDDDDDGYTRSLYKYKYQRNRDFDDERSVSWP